MISWRGKDSIADTPLQKINITYILLDKSRVEVNLYLSHSTYKRDIFKNKEDSVVAIYSLINNKFSHPKFKFKSKILKFDSFPNSIWVISK